MSAWPRAAEADAVIDWNANAGKAAIAACFLGGYGPQEARMYAMTHVAVHDALNGIDSRSHPYAVNLSATPGTSPAAAVAAAARDVLVTVLGSFSFFLPADCISGGIASVEADYAAALGAIPNGPPKSGGVALGQAAAAAILALRSSDGFDTPLVDPDYQEGTAPGEYRYTPGTPFAFAPHLGEDLTPFVLKEASQFRPGPPYSLTSRKYAADVNEIQRLGGDDVTTPSERTDDQTEIALFWVESSPLAWNRLTRAVATAEELDLWESARLFGLLNLAMTDGYIGTWDAKYHYRFWRPVTAIRLADIDGNPATTADPTWTPFLENPPIPDYDSGHAVEGGTAAQVLKRFFETDKMSFSACSFTLPVGQRCSDALPTLRHFTSFSQAADENAVSRIYVGFHFRDAVETGTKHGEKIANRAVDHFLRPSDD
ncbi:MAG TPA: vanadium-dependent haloperoxidase [Casimicrobiaceae bacterium]|nr:vanadium-dependent haloperoxidase [Casimicrobiaceae bacterium]